MRTPPNKTLIPTLLVVTLVTLSLLTIATKKTDKNIETQKEIEEMRNLLENLVETSIKIENQTKNLGKDKEKLFDDLTELKSQVEELTRKIEALQIQNNKLEAHDKQVEKTLSQIEEKLEENQKIMGKIGFGTGQRHFGGTPHQTRPGGYDNDLYAIRDAGYPVQTQNRWGYSNHPPNSGTTQYYYYPPRVTPIEAEKIALDAVEETDCYEEYDLHNLEVEDVQTDRGDWEVKVEARGENCYTEEERTWRFRVRVDMYTGRVRSIRSEPDCGCT